ncbi:MAG: aminotransferase class V-fold PLP-dependent enzyme, partial [Acidobacteriota bacterium]
MSQQSRSGIVRDEKLIFEVSKPGRKGYSLPRLDLPPKNLEKLLPPAYIRDDIPGFPEVSEVEVVRHFTRLSTWNYGVDTGLYPLGSCTMKYNPKVNEKVSALEEFAISHPYQPEELAQGNLEVMKTLEEFLAEITGMDRVSLQVAAGAHGELAGLMLIRAYHDSRNEKKTKVLIPDSAHGTNPASAFFAGYRVEVVPSNPRGCVDLEHLRQVVDHEVAALMLTNPNTLGLFEEEILQIADLIHGAGGLIYCDGANMNAL